MAAPKPSTPSRKKALLIGGGAPNSTLIAGALVAFLEQKVEFDVVSTSGAGALMGLLYTAPRNGDPRRALEEWVGVGVADPIYQFLPVNYKVFMKPGSQADFYRQLLLRNPFTRPLFDAIADGSLNGGLADWLRLGFLSLSPSNLTPNSLGLCAHLPFAEQAIDFDAVRSIVPNFYINAYNTSRSQMTIWGKDQITPEHIRAAFSFPFIYPPYCIDGEDYIEGAAIDTLNFKALVDDTPGGDALHPDLDTLVVFDILGADKLIRTPRNLYDAWVHSIITPLVEIAKDDIRLFELQHNRDAAGQEKRRLLKVNLMSGIPEGHWDKVLDWSQSNLSLLFDVGYNAGLAFCRDNADVLGLDYDSRAEPRKLAA